MANPGYLRSTDGDDGEDGSTWALANATLAGGFTDAAAGNTIYVSDAHAGTQASAMTLTSPGTSAAPCLVLCGDDVAEPPTALATTATITTTGTSAMTFVGHAYVYGITFNVGTGAGAASPLFSSALSSWWKLESCTVAIISTNAANRLAIGANSTGLIDNALELVNCIVSFANASQAINPSARFTWTGGSLAGTVPTSLFKFSTGGTPDVKIIGVDLSTIGAAKFLADLAASPAGGRVDFIDCKLGAGVGLRTGTHSGPGSVILRMINCDSGDTNYRTEVDRYEGNVYSETVIVRTGGASDGTTPFSRKMVSSAGANFVHPLPGIDIEIRNETVGSPITATVHIVHDSLTALTDAEVWGEVTHLGTSGVPMAVVASDRKATVIAAAANQTVSTADWTTTGITNVNKQQLAVTFTPQEAGTYYFRVMLAKPSYTIYYGPLVTES